LLSNARQNYLELPERNIKVIDASKSIPEVWESVKKELDVFFKELFKF